MHQGTGQTPPHLRHTTALPDPGIARSWQRCMAQNLDPQRRSDERVLESHQLRERSQALQPLLRLADPVIRHLQQQLMRPGQAILLTDAQGVILSCHTTEAERRAFIAAGLRPGADWSEASEGTNGIGTCVIERQPLTIHQQEHFRRCHTLLTCSASPIFGPDDQLLGVLDISSVRRPVSRAEQFQLTSQVAMAAQVLEQGYFLQEFPHHTILHLHHHPEIFGPLAEGLIAVSDEGIIHAINQTAVKQLGKTRAQLLGQPLDNFFNHPVEQLLDKSAKKTVILPARPARQLAEPTPLQPSRHQPRIPAGFVAKDPQLLTDLVKAGRVYERDIPLLLQGETGTGKEAFALAVHHNSSRASKPFVALNCAAIPESLIESELFGYRGGSFTGARKEGMQGKLLQADGGTLFLDEIGDMPLALQTRLLRVLEDRRVTPLGGQEQPVDIRIISASLHDLRQRLAGGFFREDLFYRLSGLGILLPPLRQRSDLPQLLDSFLAEAAHGESLHLAPAARRALLAYPWPGNVRQLRHVLRTLAALSDNGLITTEELPGDIRQHSGKKSASPATAPLEEAERQTLQEALQQHRWQITNTARALGISRNTLYRKMEKHGISRR